MTDPSTLDSLGDPPPPDRGRRTVAIAALVGLGLALVVLAGVLVVRSGGGDGPTAAPTTVLPATTTTTLPATTTTSVANSTTTVVAAPTAVLVADDQKVVVLDRTTGRPARTLFDLGASKPTDVSPPAIGSVVLSADGQTAFFDVVGGTGGGAMKRVPLRGGDVEDLGPGRAPSPSPDTSVLAFVRPQAGRPDSLVLRRADGSEAQTDLGGVDVTACGTVAWSPDSKRLAVDLCTNGEPTTVAEVEVAGVRATVLDPPPGVRWLAPAYRPDAMLTVAEDRGGDAIVVAVVGGKAASQAILRRERTTLVCLDWDRGTSLLFCEADGSVWVDPADGDAQLIGTGFHTAAW